MQNFTPVLVAVISPTSSPVCPHVSQRIFVTCATRVDTAVAIGETMGEPCSRSANSRTIIGLDHWPSMAFFGESAS